MDQRPARAARTWAILQGMPDEDAPAETPPVDPDIDDPTAERFRQDLIARGEVVPTDAELTPGATHDLDEDGVLRRRRFSAY